MKVIAATWDLLAEQMRRAQRMTTPKPVTYRHFIYYLIDRLAPGLHQLKMASQLRVSGTELEV